MRIEDSVSSVHQSSWSMCTAIRPVSSAPPAWGERLRRAVFRWILQPGNLQLKEHRHHLQPTLTHSQSGLCMYSHWLQN